MRRLRWLTLGLLFGASAWGSAQPRAAGVERLEPLLEPLAREWRSPALAAAVVRGGEIVAAGVVGVRVAGGTDPARRSDRFYVASCAKPVTATVIAKLVERGVLDWRMTLGGALPDPEMHPEFRDTELRDLFSHRAGVFGFLRQTSQTIPWETEPGEPWEVRRKFARWALREAPGRSAHARYSNGGAVVAAAIAEAATGKSFERLARELLFEPAGMHSFGYGWPAAPERPEEPRGHFREKGIVRPADLADPEPMPAFLGPAGHAHGSVLDFARFAAIHLQGLRGHDGLLSARTIETLHALPPEEESPWAYGGWRVEEERHTHGGGTATFRSFIALYPSADLGIVMMQNVGEKGVEAEGVVELLRDRYAPELDRIQIRFSQPGPPADRRE